MRKTRILEVIYFSSITKIFQEDDKIDWHVRCNTPLPMTNPDILDRWCDQQKDKYFCTITTQFSFSKKTFPR
jgi:hypothetical protein